MLEFPGSDDGPRQRYVHDPNDRGIGTVRHPRVVPRDADIAAKFRKRTLANPYNRRPAGLANAPRRPDAAGCAAGGRPPDLSDDDVLARLPAPNRERAGT